MKRSKKIVVAGHICLDVTPIMPENATFGSNYFAPCKLEKMDGIDVHTGGAVANTGLAMHILGADVLLMGKIGNDEFGRLIMDSLESYRIEGAKDMIVVPNVQTSYSIVLSPPGEGVMFLHCPGANDTFSTNDIDYSKVRDAALFHFGYPSFMRKMYENDGDELIRMYQDVKALGVATSLDLADFDENNDAGRVDWDRILRRVLPYVDFFLPSAEELCHMIDPERYKEWLQRANGDDVTKYIDPEVDIKPLAEKAISYHAKVVGIKCGYQGMYYMTADYHSLSDLGANASINLSAWANQSEWIKSFRPDVIRASTGVGDVSIAAFLVAVLDGMSIKDSARLAVAEGACCLEGYDALSTIRTLDELKKMYLMGY